MIIAVTGHRPEQIPNMGFVDIQLRHAFVDLGATHIIQGMAPGADLRAACAAFRLKLPWTSVRPWAGHTPPDDWKNHYRQAWEFAAERVTIVEQEDYPGPWAYHERNHYMVDHANIIVAVWDGTPSGGTYQTIRYAVSKGKPIFRIDPKNCEYGWLQ